MLSELEANHSQEDLAVRRSEPGEVFRADAPRHAPVQQGFNHLALQHADSYTERGGRHMIQLRAETSEAYPHDTDPSFDFEREISTFVDNATQI